jgi:hypothetical protein
MDIRIAFCYLAREQGWTKITFAIVILHLKDTEDII